MYYWKIKITNKSFLVCLKWDCRSFVFGVSLGYFFGGDLFFSGCFPAGDFGWLGRLLVACCAWQCPLLQRCKSPAGGFSDLSWAILSRNNISLVSFLRSAAAGPCLRWALGFRMESFYSKQPGRVKMSPPTAEGWKGNVCKVLPTQTILGFMSELCVSVIIHLAWPSGYCFNQRHNY